MTRIIPIKDLKNTTSVFEMCDSSNEPIYVTRNGYGAMVIMSLKTYDERMFLQDLYIKLAQAEESISEGKIITASESIEQLRNKHGL